jgi:hypothetical protein
MSPPNTWKYRRLLRLSAEQGGKCYWCGVTMIFDVIPNNGRTPRLVAACHKCNHDRADVPFHQYAQRVGKECQ